MSEINSNQSANQLVNVAQVFNSKEYIENIKASVKNGEVNPLAAFTVLKRMQKVAEEVFKDKEIKDLALAEAEKHLSGNTKSFNLYSAQICKAATYTFYDFKECNHEILDALYAIQSEVEASIKQIEEELKLMVKPDNAMPTLGITDNTKTVFFEMMPKLVWEPYGVQGTVNPPKKIQQIGLKFMKV